MGALFQTSSPIENQIGATVSREFISSPVDVISRLSFSHIRELLTIDDPLVRYFYEQECMRCTWSVRELRRQIGTNLHIRVGLKPQDVVTESDLEDALLNHLQEFLLEFGKGMCFEARQQRIIIDDEYSIMFVFNSPSRSPSLFM